MIVRYLRAALPALCLAPLLAGCGDLIADHWPHFAGGEPNGLPPRPGAPGYQQFIAHGQDVQNAPAVQNTPGVQKIPAGGQNPQAAPTAGSDAGQTQSPPYGRY